MGLCAMSILTTSRADRPTDQIQPLARCPDAPSANEVAQVNAAFAVEAAEVEYTV
jgi:hypothetical protein